MEFNSLTFILLFMPVFIFIQLLSINRTLRNILLFLSSLAFIVLLDINHLVLILLIILVTYLFGLIVNKSKIFYFLYLILIIGLLCYFKFGNYFLNSFLSFLNMEKIISPLGISFITFTSISYVSDVYYEKIEKEKNILNIFNYLLFFPTYISGPILRYQGFKESLEKRKVNLETINQGFKRFVFGLFKKVVIADKLAIIVSIISKQNNVTASLEWYGLISYYIQLLMDFDGYSDMAIGLGKMVGFEMVENFLCPYLASSITIFWRKWHITLGSWFRDYVYIPLGGNRVKTLRWIINILVVWCLTGIWHGATLNFLLWGIYNGVLIIMEKYLRDKKDSFLWIIPTQILVLFGW